MTVNKHTPGPWEVDRANPEMVYTEYVDNDGASRYICDCDSDILPQKEYEANAAFIVRACNAHDELLAALEELLKYKGVMSDESVSMAKAIIARARGEQ